MDFENIGVEEQEVAETANTSVETQDVANPVDGENNNASHGASDAKTDADTAFAAIRRAKEAAERDAAEAKAKLAEYEAMSEARKETMKRLTGVENGEIQAIAETVGLEPEDILATISAQEDVAKKDLYIKSLEKQVAEVTAEKQFQEDLIEIQKIDPSVEKLFDLGETFVALREKGVDAKSAYWAAKAEKDATKMQPAPDVGKVNATAPEKDFYTESEVDAMTPAQQRANYKKIIKSMEKW